MIEDIKHEYALELGFECWQDLLNEVESHQVDEILTSVWNEFILTTYFPN